MKGAVEVLPDSAETLTESDDSCFLRVALSIIIWDVAVTANLLTRFSVVLDAEFVHGSALASLLMSVLCGSTSARFLFFINHDRTSTLQQGHGGTFWVALSKLQCLIQKPCADMTP